MEIKPLKDEIVKNNTLGQDITMDLFFEELL